MKTHLYSSLRSFKDWVRHFGKRRKRKDRSNYRSWSFFKTKGVGQRIMAAATNSKVAVMDTAGEGGAWGIALLASYSA